MIDESSLGEMRLPKANHYEELETLSEQSFQTLFNPSMFELCSRDKRDKGIDITYEIKHSGNHTGFRFIVQLKATESIEANKIDGSYSLQIDSANINYLLNSHYPTFYVLYITNTRKFYYESVINVLKYLNQKDSEWSKKGSHVLRFNKELLPDGINQMYKDALDNGLIQRNLKEKSIRIAASVNKGDRISFDANLNVSDDAEIREMIEALGFELINDGKWQEILFVHNKATGNVASSALYNLILGIANYYAGNRWDAISFLQKATNLKAKLSDEMQMQLSYFDNVIKYAIGLMDAKEYNSRMQELEESNIVGLYIKIEQAKQNYTNSASKNTDEQYRKFVLAIQDIINHPKATDDICLSAHTELILIQGSKNNMDYVKEVAMLNALEERTGPNIQERSRLTKALIDRNNEWYKKVNELIVQAQKKNNRLAYFSIISNKVKVQYEFDVYSSNVVVVVKERPGYKPEKPNKKEYYERLIHNIQLAVIFFGQIGHVENTITASSILFEVLHYIDDFDNADKVLAQLENLVSTYDLKDYRHKLNLLKNGGTTHESFKAWLAEILGKEDTFKKEQADLVRMDEDERLNKDRSKDSDYQIYLYPIGHFRFPKDKKEKVYEILRVNVEAKKTFDYMFGKTIPVANILYESIEKEGYLEGNKAVSGLESWKNTYRIRKAFYDNKFYRIELNE